MQYLGWVGQSVVFLMTKIQNARVGDVEVKKTNFQQHTQGLPESQRKHHHHPPTGQGHLCQYLDPTSMFYFDWLFLGETITDITRKLISDTGVITLPDSLQVGQ